MQAKNQNNFAVRLADINNVAVLVQPGETVEVETLPNGFILVEAQTEKKKKGE